MTFSGTLANINTALDGLSFLSATDYNGSASVAITSDDLGNVGTGGSLTARLNAREQARRMKARGQQIGGGSTPSISVLF